MEQRDENCHKMSQIVVTCRKLSWRLSQIVVTFFFPSPSRRPLLVFADFPDLCYSKGQCPISMPYIQSGRNWRVVCQRVVLTNACALTCRFLCRFPPHPHPPHPLPFPSFSQKKRDVHKTSPVILGPKMAAPILWAPGIFGFFLLENAMPIKFLLLGGGVLGFFRRGGGWKCQFYFYGRRDSSDFPQ